MKLADATAYSLSESTFFAPLYEAGEAPKWGFRYGNWQHDPHPEILVLGAYTHPNTGNNLVGAINLNYLSQQQRDDLAQALPQIMAAQNLYGRYHHGKSLLPGIFKAFYRTYNAAHIRGVKQGVLYPKKSLRSTAADLAKTALGKVFKSKERRAKEAEPNYPQDLQGMDDMLSRVTVRLGQQNQQQPPEIDTPELQAAHQAFNQYRLDRATTTLDQQEAEPFLQATQQPIYYQPTQPQPTSPAPPVQAQQAQQQTPTKTPQQMGRAIEQERQEHTHELLDPKNDLDLGEAIVYYSQLHRRFIMEAAPFSQPLSLQRRLNRLRPQLAKAAQTVYDNWFQEPEDVNGICDEIAEALAGCLGEHGIESTVGGHEGDDHSYLVAYDAVEAWVVDINPYLYEHGGGYSWQKLEDVQFTPDDIIILKSDRPDWLT